MTHSLGPSTCLHCVVQHRRGATEKTIAINLHCVCCHVERKQSPIQCAVAHSRSSQVPSNQICIISEPGCWNVMVLNVSHCMIVTTSAAHLADTSLIAENLIMFGFGIG
jgi:hypothetical protein